jgi:hypothetical protein
MCGALPLPGKDQAERGDEAAQAAHRFQKDSELTSQKQLSLLKLDRQRSCGHTRTTLPRLTTTLELASPPLRQLGALGMLIVVVILILPL